MDDKRDVPEQRPRLSDQIRIQRRAAADVLPVGGSRPAWRVSIRRVIAFAIDCALLAAAGRAILIPAGKYMAPLGENGWWIGVVIALIYFGLMDSFIGRGKTLGKRLAGIEVQSITGGYINPIDALLRASIFAILFSIYKFWTLEDQNSAFLISFTLLADLMALAIVAFGIFHPQRRSLQDVLLNSIVVRSGASYALPGASMRRALIALLAAGAVLGGSHAALAFYTAKSRPAATARAIRYMLQTAAIPIEHVQVGLERSFIDGSAASRIIFISAYLKGPPAEDFKKRSQAVSMRIRSSLIESGLVPKDVPLASITIMSGIDIGIARRMDLSEMRFALVSGPLKGFPSIGAPVVPTIRYRSTRGLSRRRAEEAEAPESGATSPPAVEKKR